MYKRHQFFSFPQTFTIRKFCLFYLLILQFIINHKGIGQTYEPTTLLEAKVIWDMYENRKAPAGFDIEKARLAAIKLYQQLAEKNNADAQFFVAVYGKSSDFGSLNEKEIFDLLLKAANQGLPEAQYEVAMAYRLGRGIEINMQEFEKWLVKASNQGLPGAMLQYSYYVEKDHVKKIAYRQLAAIFEMLFTKQNDIDWYNHIISHNSDNYFMGANYREFYEENENLFTQKFNQSCNNSHTYGIYIPELSIMSQTRSVRAQMEFNFWDGNLTKEQTEEVCKAMLSIPVRLVYQAENASIEDETTAIAIKASASQKEIKTDGESTIEISAHLYEYTPGDQGSSVPLAGKTLQFEINAFDGIRPGRLSSPSAITDRNGIATVTYTAPSSEELQKIRLFARNTTSVLIGSPEFKAEDRAYITFTADKGRVMAYPSQGIASSECIVPPDPRFPGLIEVYLDGPSQREHAHGEITFAIRGDTPKGKLRTAGGQTGTRVIAKLDENAFAKVQYFYDDPEVPTSAFAEEIDIFTKGSAIPLVAKVHVGLNLVFESADNLYEGQNVSTRELIPLKMRIKDAWHPELDLGQILHHWGGGGERGNSMLNLRLDIQKLGSVPDYLLDHLQISKSPDERFTERMEVRSFRDEAGSIHEKNILWMPESSLHGYRGMPRVQPHSSGTHYYQASIILQDQEGKELYSRAHPASTAYLTIHTGIEANALKLWINMNPFAPQTKNAELLKAALSFKFGSLVSILDAFDAINRGDTDALFRLLFDEIKGAILDKAGSRSAHTKEAIETYTQLAMAEKVLMEIAQDQTGPIAALDDGIYQQLTKVFQSQPGQLVILQGNGNQSLRIIEAPEAPARDDAIEVGKGKRFGITISGVDKKTVNTVNQIRNAARAGGSEIPTKERSFEYNSRLNTYAWKNGGISIYLVPPGAELQEENAGKMRRY